MSQPSSDGHSQRQPPDYVRQASLSYPPSNAPARTLYRLARSACEGSGAADVWIALRSSTTGKLTPYMAVETTPHGVIASGPLDAPQLVHHLIALVDKSHRPFLSQDALSDSALKDVPTLSYRSVICAPILDGGMPIGALVAARLEHGGFSSEQREHIRLAAEQAALIVPLLTAATLSDTQTREQAALLEAARALTSTLDPHGIVNSILTSIRRVFDCETALIYQFDQRADILWVVAGLGAHPEQRAGTIIQLNDPRSTAAHVARERKPLRIQQASPDEAGPLTGDLLSQGTIALFCVPLISKDRLLGVVMLARERPFRDREAQTMESFSAIAATALENVELYQETRAQRDQQAAMFASASDAIAVVGSELQLLNVNASFARYLGKDPASLRGMTCWQAFGATAEGEDCLLCQGSCRIRSCLQSGVALSQVECEFPAARFPVPSGPNATAGPQTSGRSVAFTITPIARAKQQALLVGRDITALRQMERYRAEMIDMLSHEMRQPLARIRLNLDLINAESPDTPIERLNDFVSNIKASEVNLNALLEDLNILSQRDSGIFSIDPKPDDLAAVAREVVGESSAYAHVSAIKLDMKVDPPPPGTLPLALIDRDRAAQVIRNLISNAIKFTPQGGRVRVYVHADARWVILAVRDTGVGVAPEHKKRIFERYYQAAAPGTTGKRPGKGLGLAIVRIIMRDHGGDVHVKSQPGSGSIFSVWFPRADLPDQDSSAPSRPGAPTDI